MSFMNKLINSLPYQAKFSMDEIIPALEKKISSLTGEEYTIDFFITNSNDSGTLNVRYLAFPKQESYVKALFSYEDFIYKFTKTSKSNETLKKIDASNIDTSHMNFSSMMEIQESEKVFLIAQEEIQIGRAFCYLTMPHEERYYLYNDFFCYNPELDALSDTITEFANKKIPQK